MQEDKLNREALARQQWHALAPDEVIELLQADPERGLDAAEVERRRQLFGENSLPQKRRETLLAVFLRQFKDPLIYVLLIAGTASLFIGRLDDAAFIFAVLLFNAVLGTYQEYKAESAAEALQQMMKITAQVRRDGKREQLDSKELVPGDLVVVEAGNAVPGDIRLLSSQNLRVDESLLTGESVPVDKQAQAQLEQEIPLGDRATLLYAGSTVMSGRARGLVCATGQLTEIGRIAESLTEEEQVAPLVVRMRRFTRVIALAIVGVVFVLGLAQLARGESLLNIFFLAVALAVSAIPAGLPVAITVALSIASHRMARRQVIVRKLPAVEGLGACTLIASDKTGTLTENKLTATKIRPLRGDDVEVEGQGYTTKGELRRNGEQLDPAAEQWLQQLVVSGTICNEAELELVDDKIEAQGDTVDIAFLVLARKLGLRRDELLAEQPQLGSIPFESERRFAATFTQEGERAIAHVKGAAQALVKMCDVEAELVQQKEQELASQGFRVLAVARGEVDRRAAVAADNGALHGLTFLGLIGLIDPIRQAVPEAVQKCAQAGIEVRMITGDHPATALAIGRQLGLTEEQAAVVTGKELAQQDDQPDSQQASQLKERVQQARVYARVEPRQKTTIVRALSEAGHFIAVTGDGVNDAPALRAAHIGVAMGASGTDVARNAADLILTDDNFASIVNGVEEGRIAYDNVRKVIWLLISTGAAELVLFALSVALGTPLPLMPVQLLWLNVVTNGIQDVALAFERGEPGVLARQPRAPQEPIFNRQMIEQVATSGLFMGLVGFAVFYLLLEVWGVGLFDARNLLLLLMVLFENVHAFNVRSEVRSVLRVPLSANKLLVSAVLLAQGIHIASMFIPYWGSEVLSVAPVSPVTWLILLALALGLMLLAELYKATRAKGLASRRDAQRHDQLQATS